MPASVSSELCALQSEALRTVIDRRIGDYVTHLRRLVEINSFSLNRSGVRQVGEATAEMLEPLGFAAEFVPSADRDYGDHLFLRRDSPEEQGPGAERTIALVAHLDTVYSLEEQETHDFFWSEEGDRIYGPGVNDIKGGIVMIWLILEALATEFPVQFDSVNWLVALNSSEEATSPDFPDLCRTRMDPNPLACLVFESGSLDDNRFAEIVTGRKGRAVATISVEGRGSHAGHSHDTGCNAIVKLADLISQISTRTDYSTQTTYNVGTIHGGTVVNTVPHFAEAAVEMRTYNRDAYERAVTFLESLATAGERRGGEGFRIRVDVERDSLPWIASDGTTQIFTHWKNCGRDLKLDLQSKRRGGLSDANELWRLAPTLDGLGPGGGNAHTSQRTPDGSILPEYLDLPTVAPKTLLNAYSLLRLIENLGG